MAFLIYSLLRLLLVVASAVVLHLLGVRDVLLLAGAIVLGALLSYLLLAGPRRRAVASMDRFVRKPPAAAAPDADARAEDALLDSAAPTAPGAGASAEGEHQPDPDADPELEDPGALEDADERGTARAVEHASGEERGGEREGQ